MVKSPTTSGSLPGLFGPVKTDRRVVVFLCLWTLFVAVALWWLLRPVTHTQAGPWILHRGEAATQPWPERVRDWFRLLDLNFHRVYPWVLLGPYVGWLAWHCSLERGRLRLSLPVHLGACALFVLASYAIDSRSSMRVARIVVITSLRDEQVISGEATNHVRVEVSEQSSGGLGGEIMHEGFLMRRSNAEPGPDVLGWNPDGLSGGAFSNFFFKAGGGLERPTPPELPSMRPLTTLLDLLAYGAVVGLAHSIHFYGRYREREHRALFLESNLAKARLGALQAQLHPHFLFNSLNAVVTLLRRDPKLAEATLTSLSDLLRLTLSQSARQEVPLREELSFVERYMEIQHTRFGERLRFEQQVEPAVLDCLVPALLLQPLVENSLRHGIEPSENAGLVQLHAYRQDRRLIVTVEDDGIGLADGNHTPGGAPVSSAATSAPSGSSPRRDSSDRAGTQRGTGIGLANLRARLEALYGDQQSLELTSREPHGVRVRIEIPCRTESETPPLENAKAT